MTNYRRKKRPQRVIQKRFTINERLAGEKFRIIDEEGNMLGVFSREEAFALSDKEEKDLIEVNPKAEPPVIKLMPFAKFKYNMSKSGNDKIKPVKDLKIVRVSVRVSDNDLLIAAKKCVKFLEKGLKVKLQAQMRGREKAYPDVARDVIEKLISLIEIDYNYENTPELGGDSYHATIKAKTK